MLSLNECRTLIDDRDLSDEEIKRNNDACYELAEIALNHIESLMEEIKVKTNSGVPGHAE